MQTLAKPKAKGKESQAKVAPAEQSVGIRVCDLCMVLLLILAASSYVATMPVHIFIYTMVALAGSYLSYHYRNSRPKWVSILPVLGTILLAANFLFELSFALGAAAMAPPAVTAFVHVLAGLLALHTFDLRSRTDFSISALIGLGVLTFLTGVARDAIFGVYVLLYTVLGGALLFYDSSSRSHEIGPSRAVADSPVAGQPMIRRLRVASLAAMLPILLIPIISVITCFVLPKGESVLELFIDGFRSQFPLSASMSGSLSTGGRSQSVQGGAPQGKKEGGSSFTAKGGDKAGTASSAGPAGANSKPTGPGGTGGGNGSGGVGPGAGGGAGKESGGKKGSAIPGFNGKKQQDFDPGDMKMQEAVAKEAALQENYNKEMVELKSAPSDLEAVVLMVASPSATYTRRYTLDTFDGSVWKRALPVPSKAIDPTEKVGFDLTACDAVYVPPDLPTEEITQEFRLEKSMGHIIPHSWIPQIVKSDDQQIRIDGDATLKLLKPMPDRYHYTVTSQVPVYDLEVMRRLAPETLYQLDEDRENELKTAQTCLQLPKSLSQKIKDMGGDAAGIEGNWFSKAERIAEYMKSHYRYDKASFYTPSASDNQTGSGSSSGISGISGTTGSAGEGQFAPSEKDKASLALKDVATQSVLSAATKTSAPPKPGESDVEKFLIERKTGNCRHFASAFALLCRTQGIPARVVVGFLPGELNKKSGYREVRGKDTHVWAEVYIPYWNWVPFDPTPGGTLPTHQEGGNPLSRFISSGLANPFGQNVNQRASRKHAASMPGGQNDKKGDKGQDPSFDANKNKPKGSTFTLPLLGTIDQGQMQSMIKLVGVVILFVCIAIAVIIFLRQQKTAKAKEMMSEHAPSTMLFLEVLGELKRYDFVKQPTETADELSDRARYQFSQLSKSGKHIPRELPEVVSEFMELYSEERFGGADNLDDLHELHARIKELSHAKAGR